MSGGRHIGRHWPGSDNRIERECPCPQLPCGLVDSDHARKIKCPQHWFGAARTIRDMHDAASCPAKTEER